MKIVICWICFSLILGTLGSLLDLFMILEDLEDKGD